MRRSYEGAAAAAQLTTDLASSTAALTIFCTDLTNWPTGVNGYPFYIVINRGKVNEEKILCSSRTGNVLTVYDVGLVNGRAADDTSIAAHTANSVVEHIFTATDADEANAHVNASSGVHGLTGSVVGTTDTQTLTNKTLTSPILTTPQLGTPTSGTLTNATGLPISTGISGLGTGVATALAVNTGSSGAFITNGGALGTPSSGTLSACTVDGTDSVGFRNIPQNSQSAAYTLVLADAGKHIFHPSTDANARTYTIPANSSVAYPIGTAITFINMTSQVVTIAITTDTMYLSSAGTTGSRSLAQYGSATAIKMTSTTWLISGSGLT